MSLHCLRHPKHTVRRLRLRSEWPHPSKMRLKCQKYCVDELNAGSLPAAMPRNEASFCMSMSAVSAKYVLAKCARGTMVSCAEVFKVVFILDLVWRSFGAVALKR